MIISGKLAHAGLVKQQLQFSKSTTLTGPRAKSTGYFCLALFLLLLAGVVWLTLITIRG